MTGFRILVALFVFAVICHLAILYDIGNRLDHVNTNLAKRNDRVDFIVDSLSKELKQAHAWSNLWRERDSIHIAQAVTMSQGTKRAHDFILWAKRNK